MMDTELDMELTPERKAHIKETLLRLWADQNGVDYETMTKDDMVVMDLNGNRVEGH